MINEGLSKTEKNLMKEINKHLVKEAPISYEGPERMDPELQKKIEQKDTPYSLHPAMPKYKKESGKDFVEVTSSKRFKDSVNKVRYYLGDTRSIQGQNPMMSLMMTVMGALQKIKSIENRNEEYLEKLAVDLVKKEMGLPEGSMNFEAELVGNQLQAAPGMQGGEEEPDEEEVEQAFQQNQPEIEDFMDAMDKFNLEKAKRRFINSLIQGASKKGHYMFELVRDELNRLNPELVQLYGVTQSLMDHLYWLMPDMESMVAGGGGQAGQSEFETDEETGIPTVKAKGLTFPILIHELIKGVYEVFGTHGLPDDPRQAEMVIAAEDTLPAEVWDMRLGPIFWEKFLQAHPAELFEEEQKYLQHYLFMRFSKLEPEEFFELSKQILMGRSEANQILQRMVDEIVAELKEREMEEKGLSGEDYDDDDEDIDIPGF
jgi:hypothetical protein